MTTRTKPWMCLKCGYVMDAATAADAKHRPMQDDDIGSCTNCGDLTIWRDGRFVPMTSAERASLSPDIRRQMLNAEIIRALMKQGRDLSKSKGTA